jgi:hypothetical protein
MEPGLDQPTLWAAANAAAAVPTAVADAAGDAIFAGAPLDVTRADVASDADAETSPTGAHSPAARVAGAWRRE